MAPALALLPLILAALSSPGKSAKVCGRPRVADGVDVSAMKRVFEVGEEVALTCERGYLPSAATPPRITCTASGDWSQSGLSCSPNMCSIPRPLQPFAMGRTQVPFKSVLNYSCDDGYVIVGANESRCLADGSWSSPAPVCKAVSCPLPKPPREGRIVYDKTVTGATTVYGQGWTYECNPPKAPTYERGSCSADGTVREPPLCREVSCPVPKPIPHGFITFAVRREHGYKERVRYACEDHYTLDGEAETRCQNTGNWSSPPACRAPCAVGIKRGRVFYKSRKVWIEDLKPNRVLHGEHVVFYCLNKTEKCGFPVASSCDDGRLDIPECFEEPGKIEYNLKSKNLPSEIRMCAAHTPAGSPTPS